MGKINYIHLEPGVHTFNVAGPITLFVHTGETRIHWHGSTQCEYAQATVFKSNRYVCNCPPGLMQDEPARFARQVLLELPGNSLDRARRIREGLSTSVAVDPCIVDAIQALWEKGVETLGSCCGHNKMRAWVAVHRKDYERMFELGYEQRPVECPKPGVVHGLYTFYL